MADPIVKKITQLTEATSIAADDLIAIVDVSETIAANKTKKAIARLITLYNTAQISDGIIIGSKIADGAVTADKLSANAVDTNAIADGAVTPVKLSDPTIAQSLIYIKLFGAKELIVTESAKEYFFVPSYLSGKKIKKMGIGVVTPGSSNTTVALGSYASVSGNGFIEGSDINVSLPSVGTKIPINVTAGGGSPKGLDCWFVVGA